MKELWQVIGSGGVWLAAALLFAQSPEAVSQPAARPEESPSADSSSQPAPSTPDEATREKLVQHQGLWKLAQAKKNEGQIADAVETALKMLVLERELLGENDAEIVLTLNWISGLQERCEDFAAATRLRTEAVAIATAVHGESHWKSTDARLALQHCELLARLTPEQRRDLTESERLYGLCVQAYREGKFHMALPVAVKIVAAEKSILGEEHRTVSSSLNLLGSLLMQQDNYAEAEPILLQVLAIRKKILGLEHPDTATSLNNLAQLYNSTGAFAKAVPFQQEALEANVKMLGLEHAHTAACLSNLAGLEKALGSYDKAEELNRQALAIRRKVLGDEHPDTALSLLNLGLVLQIKGDLVNAEPLYQQSLEIRKKLLGPEHPETATCLNNLGALYSEMGDFAQAELLLTQALELTRKTLGDEHLDTAVRLNNLASIHQSTHDYGKSIAPLEQALAIQVRILGQSHPRTATTIHNLAFSYQSLGEFAKAEPLMRQAMELHRQALGDEHPETASIVRNCGFLLMRLGKYHEAELLLRQALESHRKVLGNAHATTATSLNKLAILYLLKEDYGQGELLAREAVEILFNHLEATFAGISERQKLLMLEDLRDNLDLWLSLAREVGVSSQQMYARLLAWKGTVFASETGTRSLRQNAAAAELFVKYQETSRQLATLALASPQSAEERIERDRRLEKLTAEKDTQEQQLSRMSAGFESEQQVPKLMPNQLKTTLPDDVALVDFFEYSRLAVGEKPGEFTISKNLLAFIMRKGQPLVGYDFGPVAPIAAAIDRWRSCYGVWTGSAEDDPARQLHETMWQPIAAHCRGAKIVLVSPDGAVAQLPFAALPGERPDQFLLHDFAFATIPVPQLVPRMFAARPVKADADETLPSLLLVGDVNYGGEPGKADDGSRALNSVTRSALIGGFSPLPSAFDEITSISGRFRRRFGQAKIDLLDQDLATEAAFRQHAPQHRWIHVSTHGFFAPPQLNSALNPGESKSPEATLFDRDGVGGVHPGLLSGLAMSGANLKALPGNDDGILTSLEVSALDLSKVDVAVLSACETGLGRVAGGEGLLGLQRAFQVAGAKTVVASLWKVPDRATMLLMQRFYRNLWENRMTKLAAFHEAQIWMLSDPSHRGFDSLEDESKQLESSNTLPPKYWAAFILSGDWR